MKDLAKKKFGKLTVSHVEDKDKNNHVLWLCLCDCGNETVVSSSHLITAHTQSCGCLKNTGNNTKHGHSKSETYKVWANMIQRCTNPHSENYDNYGGRGIIVCKRWMKFENFLTDMGNIPEGCQIDRINNDKGYYRVNCRWATPKQNSRNRRNNHLATHNGKTQCITAWAEEIGISKYTIYKRLRCGWSIEKALTTPVKQRKVRRIVL